MNESDKDTVLTTANSVTSIPPLMADDEEGYPAEPPGAPPMPVSQDGTPMYKYRDFGHIEEDDEGVGSDIPAPAQSNRGGSESSIRVQKFPVKLYAILAQKEFHDIICWMPHGRSWKVLKPSMFESLVMPLFFEYSNYHSFNRLVNAWSFRRISSGPDRGSYYHEVSARLRGSPCDFLMAALIHVC
jgi:HSF-type DNA-binding